MRFAIVLALAATFMGSANAQTSKAAPKGVEQAALDNAEMARLFAADQAIRERFSKEGFSQKLALEMVKGDLDRYARTQRLMQSGALSTGQDFYRAAFIFQHGSKPSDYLLAHSLAVAAVARGKTDATWIAAATLDRYLQAIGQKQIYGTQFDLPRGEPVTQEPYDRDLIPDALRKVLGVPVQSEQEQRRLKMQARHLSGKPAGAKP